MFDGICTASSEFWGRLANTSMSAYGCLFSSENGKDLPEETKSAKPRQRLALHVLRENDLDLPKLVPEHVETRTLYHPMHPKIVQVKTKSAFTHGNVA